MQHTLFCRDSNKEDALEELEEIVRNTFPGLPKAKETIIHKWKYSQERILNVFTKNLIFILNFRKKLIKF